MKSILTFTLLLAFMLLPRFPSSAAVQAPPPDKPIATSSLIDDFVPGLSVQQFLALTPKKIRETTGQKLSLKETIALKTAQRKIKKAERADSASAGQPKNQVIALILVILFGCIGIHRFYLGYTGIGILQILTLGGCGIWTLIDLIRIAFGDLRPARGGYYDPTL